MEKVEELTLYVIELKKEIEKLKLNHIKITIKKITKEKKKPIFLKTIGLCAGVNNKQKKLKQKRTKIRNQNKKKHRNRKNRILN